MSLARRCIRIRSAAVLLAGGLPCYAMPASPPPDAVPFFCSATAEVDSESVLQCIRSDTREAIATVPQGMLFLVTDIMTLPATSEVSGVFLAQIGVDRADLPTPGAPSVDLIGFPLQQFNFTTPYIVLLPGEALSVFNYSGSDFEIEVRVAGYMASAFVEPLPETIFQDSFEASE